GRALLLEGDDDARGAVAPVEAGGAAGAAGAGGPQRHRAVGEPLLARPFVDEGVERGVDADADGLRGPDGEPVRLLVLEAQAAGALVRVGDGLRPPAVDLTLVLEVGGGVAVAALLRAPAVEDREPRLPAAAGRLGDPLVGRAVGGGGEPLARRVHAVALLRDVCARGGVALAGLGHALADAALERRLPGHNHAPSVRRGR